MRVSPILLAFLLGFSIVAVWPSETAAQDRFRKEKNWEDLTPAEHTAAKKAALERKLSEFVVCADPGNMPLSNIKGEGYQNKIAEVLAKAMDTKVSFFWRPYIERGLTRETFDNRECEALLDMPADYEGLLTTEPIYRTTYVLAYRSDKGISPFTSLDDPRLNEMRIGVFQHSGVREALSRRGIKRENIEVHVIRPDGDLSPENQPWRQVQKVVDGELDVAAVWGPFAGYVEEKLGAPLTLQPVNMMDDTVPLEFDLAIGMRRDDAVLKYMLDNALKESKDEIAAILESFGVPLVECSRCIVAGKLPSHGSYYSQLRQVSLDRFLASTQYARAGASATKDQIVDRARLEGWLEDGADPNVELANAVLGGDPERVRFLVDKGADLKRRDGGGYQPLQSAARHRNDQLIAILLELGADPNDTDSNGWTALMHAAYRNHVPSVKTLAAGGANLEAAGSDGYPALALAIGEQKYFAAKALIEAGADVSSPVGAQKLTPLMLIASMPDADTREGQLVSGQGTIETARALIEKGADVNAGSANGVTPLMVAAANNRPAMIGFLVQQGADPARKSVDGKTALDFARQNLSEGAVTALKLLTPQQDETLTR